MAITNRDFVVGSRLKATHKSRVYTVEAVEGTEKRPLLWRVVEPEDFANPFGVTEGLKAGLPDGKTFSLSSAEDAITFPTLGPSPYVFFTREEEWGNAAATKAEKAAARVAAKAEKEAKAALSKGDKAAAKAAAKAEKEAEKAAKKALLNRKVEGYTMVSQLPDGRWFCAGCCAPFAVAEGETPEDCPEGHIAKGVQDFVNRDNTPLAGEPRPRKAKAEKPVKAKAKKKAKAAK